MSEPHSGSKLADTFGSSSNDAFLSGDNRIDSLLAGYDWTGALHQAATNITYTISGPTEGHFVSDLNGAMAAWERVANVHFTYVSPSSPAAASANIVVVDDTGLTVTATGAELGVTSPTTIPRQPTQMAQAEVHVTTNANVLQFIGSLDPTIIMTTIHELGHALGLKHPENYSSVLPGINSGDGLGPFLPVAAATYDNTLMAYTPGAIATQADPPQTPMPYDVLVMQWLYGPNMNYTPQTYKIDGSATTQTIWNPVGTSTFDTTHFTGNATINLKQGMGSTVGQSNYFIAYGTHIGTLDTGPGNDSITANNLGDEIKTAPGNDTIHGGAGNDTIIASTGNSIIQGGKGNNILIGGYGNDTIFGQTGNDTMTGGTGKNNLYAFLDTNGPTGNDKIENFNPYGDQLEFSSKIFSTAAQAYAALQQSGVINLTDGGSITLVNINHNILSASDFIITT